MFLDFSLVAFIFTSLNLGSPGALFSPLLQHWTVLFLSALMSKDSALLLMTSEDSRCWSRG